jgi:hypothetical protein
MDVVEKAASELRSSRQALALAWQNGLLRASGEELVTLAEHRQCMADDANEIVETLRALEAATAELKELSEKQRKIEK